MLSVDQIKQECSNWIVTALDTHKSMGNPKNKIYPTYYLFSDGREAVICDYLEAPGRALDACLCERWSLINILAIICLAIPAFIGNSLSSTIYRVKGEKIKRLDYDAALTAWTDKVFFYTSNQELKGIREFVNFCIQSRISPKNPSFNVLLAKMIPDTTRYIFQPDGPYTNFRDPTSEGRTRPLVLYIADQPLNKICPEVKAEFPSSQDILANYCITRSETGEDYSASYNKAHYLWLRLSTLQNGSLRLSLAEANHLRQSLSQIN